MANYASLITSPYWQKNHEEAMLIQVRSFPGKQNNPSITCEWPGRDNVWSDPLWEASSNLRENSLKSFVCRYLLQCSS